MNKSEILQTNRGWVLFDGACSFCTRWAAFWSGALKRRGFEIAPLQAPEFAGRLGLRSDELLADLRLLLPGGRLLSGAEVYLYLARRIWWAWPFWALFGLPGFHALLRTGYRWFAENRYCVSGAC